MTTNRKKDGLRYIKAEARKLLSEETKEPKGTFYGLKVDPNAKLETIEALLKLAGRARDLNSVKVRAMKKYGEAVL